MKPTYTSLLRTLCRGALCLTAAAALSACIDEDLSRCGKDYALTYRFLLQTSLDETLARELTTPAERQLATPLRAALAPLFSEQAQDLTLHFHHPATGERLYYEEHLVGSREAGFTLYLPEQDYSHVALANLGAEPAARTTGADNLSSLAWEQETEGDTVPSLSQSLFCGWQYLSVGSGQTSFFMPLYMQDCAAVWVIDPRTAPVASYEAYIGGTASGFLCADSAFTFDPALRVRTRQVTGGGLTAVYAGCLPSPDSPAAASAASPGRSDYSEADGAYWTTYLYVRLASGEVTRNELYVRSPLKAGELKVLKLRLNDRGEAVADEREVGVSVTLDWKPGGDFDVEM